MKLTASIVALCLASMIVHVDGYCRREGRSCSSSRGSSNCCEGLSCDGVSRWRRTCQAIATTTTTSTTASTTTTVPPSPVTPSSEPKTDVATSTKKVPPRPNRGNRLRGVCAKLGQRCNFGTRRECCGRLACVGSMKPICVDVLAGQGETTTETPAETTVEGVDMFSSP